MPVRDGYQYLSRVTIYGIVIMVFLVFILASILSIAINPTTEKLVLTAVVTILLASIVIVYFWYQKLVFKPQKIEDYSLKK
ncbi:MAG: hypothetical protein ACW99A_09920 [Candidatus Kariarchaeaceae archaeon]|jgi:nitric oxide reductase large subunit